MGLFTRRRHLRREVLTAAGEGWQPLDGSVIEVPGFEMDDDECAGEQAYGAEFQLEAAPCATLTVWFYPCPRSEREEDGFVIGRRFEHIVYEDGRYAWSASTYDVADSQGWYGDLEAADAGARRIAGAFASGFTTEPGQGGGTGFDWDGEAW